MIGGVKWVQDISSIVWRTKAVSQREGFQLPFRISTQKILHPCKPSNFTIIFFARYLSTFNQIVCRFNVRCLCKAFSKHVSRPCEWRRAGAPPRGWNRSGTRHWWTFWISEGLKPMSDFKTQHKLHNKLEIKANNSIFLPQTSSESLELGFFGKLWMLYITDYIWLPWLKHTFWIWLLGWSCPVDWAPKRWDRAKGFDQTSNRTVDIIDISLHLPTSSHCMSLHHQTNKFIVEHSTRNSDTNPLNKARLIKCYRLALRTKFHKHKFATAKSHDIIPNTWTSTSSHAPALSHAQTLTCNRGWPAISIDKQSLNCISRVNSNCIRFSAAWASSIHDPHTVFCFAALFISCRFTSVSAAAAKDVTLEGLQTWIFHTDWLANVGTWRDFTGRAMESFCVASAIFFWLAHVSPPCRFHFFFAEDFWFLPTKSHCHHTPIWLRSPRGGDENLTSNEN